MGAIVCRTRVVLCSVRYPLNRFFLQTSQQLPQLLCLLYRGEIGVCRARVRGRHASAFAVPLSGLRLSRP